MFKWACVMGEVVKHLKRILAIGAAVVLSAHTAQAQTGQTDAGRITLYAAGYGLNVARVVTTAPLVDLGCGLPDGYLTNPNDPGSTLYQSTLLSAYLAGRQVQLILNGCYLQRPQIIGVIVLPQ
ncbi:hypothetical protein [Nitrospirillum sp. BR 11163]|uniref:hypothetical protein n=1 Tax=Nitrospirillum sp. BR 11163 TaxID=3104323 RepID=UPI002AFE063C|nr:hypothetical protein [Nitrospirillum sp. BR 11163]MEA1672309.1 hypothetical protein [Nitrospirillum sp. BR 11163]